MVNDKTAHLPDSVIKANGFICLVSSGDIEHWNNSLPTVFIKGLPALGNSGFVCCLFYQYNSIIDAFIYNPAQVTGEGFKKDGGWSTERIDTNNKSGSADNFHFSMDLNGGTPGKSNSVQDENPDNAAPQITSLKLFDKKQLLIDFSETMDFDNMSSIEITPALQISKQSYDTLFLNQLQVEFEDDLVSNAIHHLKSINIYDLAGNQLALETPISFGVPDTLEHGDVLLNEVLFNPYPDATDFVELYNASDKLINLADLYFAEIKGDQIEKLHPISNKVQLFEPHSYTAITTNKESLLQHYQCQQPGAIIETTSLPSLPDDEGLVAISNKKGIILEQFSYHQNMHFDLLKDKEGVSLERLSWQQATQASNNWQSATSTAGFATPGYINSQQLNSPVETNGIVSITPEVFTPNNDGSDDRLQILINSQEANSIVTIRIFDSNGKEVRYLVNNQSLADNSLIFWDGLNDDGTRLKPGIYLIFVQCVYPSGKVHEEKISCVIGVDNN
jgi:hypothetical protein